MRRFFWVSIGIGLGAAGAYLATRKVNEILDRYSPTGSHSPLAPLVQGAQGMWRELRANQAERETELREALLMPSEEEAAAAQQRWNAARPGRGERSPHAGRPGGLQPGDLTDPLYDF